MTLVFADTQFFVGRVNARDQWHKQARAAETALIDPHYITTESVLTEVLAYFCEYGPESRLKAAVAIEIILADPKTEVVSISHELFLQGVKLYKERLDKSYSLTDCISMNVCRSRGITDVLSHDHHFVQEGLTVLM